MKYACFTLLVIAALFSSCKKKYTCACGEVYNSDSKLKPVLEIKAGSKAEAESQCAAFFNTHAHFPETVCRIQ